MRKFLCIVLSLTATSAFAGPIKGAGATTCGDWLKDRKNETYYPQLNWVLGFVSSYNYYVYVGKNENGVFGNADFSFVSTWMDNYCQKNPEQNIFAGAVKLMAELRGHAGQAVKKLNSYMESQVTRAPGKRKASCSCGQLHLIASGEPVRISICHCLACQRRTGSPFGQQARFPADEVTIAGQSHTYVRTGDSGTSIAYHFCPSCSSIVFYRIEDQPDLIAVPVGAFADPSFPAPRVSVYGHRKHPWVVLPAGIEHEPQPDVENDDFLAAPIQRKLWRRVLSGPDTLHVLVEVYSAHELSTALDFLQRKLADMLRVHTSRDFKIEVRRSFRDRQTGAIEIDKHA